MDSEKIAHCNCRYGGLYFNCRCPSCLKTYNLESMMQTWKRLFTICFLLTVFDVHADGFGDTVHLDLAVSADKLMWALTSVRGSQKPRAVSFLQRTVGDINLDGVDEVLSVYSRQLSNCNYVTVVVCYSDPTISEALFQYNGPIRTTAVNSVQLIDVWDDRRPELLMTQIHHDTVFFEVLSFQDSVSYELITIPAAIADPERLVEGWQDVHIWALAGIDVNSDGYRDLIYSRSAKPDSAFQRGIVAYDVEHGFQIWSYETADMITPKNYHHVIANDSQAVSIYATYSNVNVYAANGMVSRRAYLFALNDSGVELWRHTIGGEFFYPVSVAADINDDGRAEIFVTCQPQYSDSGFRTPLVCVDALTGATISDCGQFIQTPPIQLAMLERGEQGSSSLLATIKTDDGSIIADFDLNLNLRKLYEGKLVGIKGIGDLLGDSTPEILILTADKVTAVLNTDMDVLGRFDGFEDVMFCQSTFMQGLLFDGGINGFDYVLPEKRSPLIVLYAKFKYLLAIILTAVLAVGLYRFVRWITSLYQRSAGLIGLDKIDAMVLVLNRRGKILFANNNPVTNLVLGNERLRGKHFDRTNLARYDSLIEALRNSYIEIYRPVEGRHQILCDSSEIGLDVVIYPRLGDNNSFQGKIVIAEDVRRKVGWERKIVLGEAAQRWVHRLKGSMATARITLENLQEDPDLTPVLAANEGFKPYLSFLSGQISETAKMATKILQFTRIGKPNLVRTEICSLISRCVAPYEKYRRSGIVVVERQHKDLPSMMIDPDQISDVIDNLLTNAVNAIQEKGDVVVLAHLASNLLKRYGGTVVEIVVEDTGCGIAVDNLEHVFTPGYSRFSSGTGIGLAVVKEIIENHGGRVRVESKLGEGSRFSIILPID